MLLALACFDGAASELAIGSAAVAVWVTVLTLLLGRGLVRVDPTPAALAAGAALFGLLALTALSLIWTIDQGTGFGDLVRLFLYLGIFVLVTLLARRGGARPWLIGLALAGVGVALLALAARLAGFAGGGAELAAALPSAAGRLSYPIGYWNALAALMALTMPVLIWLACDLRRPRPTALALAAMVPIFLVAYMTSSRGGLLALAIGAAVMIRFAERPLLAAGAFALGLLGAAPAVVAATVQSEIVNSAPTTPGGPELVVAIAALAGAAAVLVAGPPLLLRIRRIRRRVPVHPRALLAVAVVALFALIAIAGPSTLVGDLTAPAEADRGADGFGLASASGSGRAQYWAAAFDAFAEDPLQGVGAGGYGTYWNQKGSLGTSVRNAHSEPLEMAAELGIVGPLLFISFLGVVLLTGFRRARAGPGGPRPEAGAAFAVVVAALIGLGVDWIWQVPAVIAPLLIAAALLCGTVFLRPGEEAGVASLLISRDVAGVEPLASPSWMPAPLTTAVVLVLAVPALWAGLVLAISADRLEAGEAALERGQLGEAATAARSAAAIRPWDVEPWLLLAGAEQAGDNLGAAQRAAAEAIERAPQDFRPWLLTAGIQRSLGRDLTAAAYGQVAVLLAPQVLERSIGSPGVRNQLGP